MLQYSVGLKRGDYSHHFDSPLYFKSWLVKKKARKKEHIDWTRNGKIFFTQHEFVHRKFF